MDWAHCLVEVIALKWTLVRAYNTHEEQPSFLNF